MHNSNNKNSEICCRLPRNNNSCNNFIKPKINIRFLSALTSDNKSLYINNNNNNIKNNINNNDNKINNNNSNSNKIKNNNNIIGKTTHANHTKNTNINHLNDNINNFLRNNISKQKRSSSNEPTTTTTATTTTPSTTTTTPFEINHNSHNNNINIVDATFAKRPKKEIDIIFMLDSSASVAKDGWIKSIQFVKSLLGYMTVGEDSAQVSVISFNNDPTILINGFKRDNNTNNNNSNNNNNNNDDDGDDYEDLDIILDESNKHQQHQQHQQQHRHRVNFSYINTPHNNNNNNNKCTLYEQLDYHSDYKNFNTSGYTNTHKALFSAFSLLNQTRTHSKKILVLISDGNSNLGEAPAKFAEEMILSFTRDDKWDKKSFGPKLEIFAFGIGKNSNFEELNSIALNVDSTEQHVYSIENFVDSSNNDNDVIYNNNNNNNDDDDTINNSVEDINDMIFNDDTYYDKNINNNNNNKNNNNNNNNNNKICTCSARRGRYVFSCPPGYEMADAICTECKLGYYSNVASPAPCQPCPEELTTNQRGSTVCDKRRPGYFSCPDLDPIPNAIGHLVPGLVRDESYLVSSISGNCANVTNGNTCHFRCRKGFRLFGSPYLICDDDGSWKGDVPICARITCPRTLPMNPNYDVTLLNNSYTYLSMVELKCKHGFFPLGPTTYQCDEYGVWRHVHKFYCVDASSITCPRAKLDRYAQFDSDACYQERVPIDTEPPRINCRDDVILELYPGEYVAHYVANLSLVSMSDNSGIYKGAIHGAPENSFYHLGEHFLVFVVTDDVGLSSQCVKKIIVRARKTDITCPSNQTVYKPMNMDSIQVNWEFPQDNDPNIKVECNLESGSSFQDGTFHVSCLADELQHCDFFVNVIDLIPNCSFPLENILPTNGYLDCLKVNSAENFYKYCFIRCPKHHKLFGTKWTRGPYTELKMAVFKCTYDNQWFDGSGGLIGGETKDVKYECREYQQHQQQQQQHQQTKAFGLCSQQQDVKKLKPTLNDKSVLDYEQDVNASIVTISEYSIPISSNFETLGGRTKLNIPFIFTKIGKIKSEYRNNNNNNLYKYNINNEHGTNSNSNPSINNNNIIVPSNNNDNHQSKENFTMEIGDLDESVVSYRGGSSGEHVLIMQISLMVISFLSSSSLFVVVVRWLLRGKKQK
ncbi:hypothetical protein HELRODRAFT_159828 [Helobdella robusta]|uniref:Sushi, von Willebrand factor type A, EGF and pentraxin domain-containing protein 1 n=1 Tax=Helobdella robusta TaxID=6412 RepID=T1EPG1_HELRO|nr:hypothetical protein HELRODRAFT_159828 [Helobdella robusta]ESO13195.1 hypothetical protein HELRODRAFT_159828 [Helobdella robusta]